MSTPEHARGCPGIPSGILTLPYLKRIAIEEAKMPHARGCPSEKGSANSATTAGYASATPTHTCSQAVDNLSITVNNSESPSAPHFRPPLPTARAFAAARRPVYSKIRLAADLYARAARLAADVGDPAARWLRLSALPSNQARHAHIDPPPALTAADGPATVASVEGPLTLTPDEFRRAVARAVLYCEARRADYRNTLIPHVTKPRDGIDYILTVGDQ